MKKGKDYGLLIASMVAIVAIVGLVIMFSSGTTGAFAKEARSCWYEGGTMVCDDGTGRGETGTGSFEKTPRDNPRIIRETNVKPFASKPETG